MAPIKVTNSRSTIPIKRSTTARNKTSTLPKEPRAKRKADCSPVKEDEVKRSALGDVTNAAKQLRPFTDNKCNKKPQTKSQLKSTVQKKVLSSFKTVKNVKQNENVPLAPRIQTRAVTRLSAASSEKSEEEKPIVKVKTRLSNEFDKTEESVYWTAPEDLTSSDSSSKSEGVKLTRKRSLRESSVSFVAEQIKVQLNLGNHNVPENVVDFDKENWNDTIQVSHYAMDIFNYLKNREYLFVPKDYINQQPNLTIRMRSMLVDWMVEIQESFELNHETLYLAVKLVDLYLSKVMVNKDTLQLVGAAAMFIASKYDERMPPLVDDFLYICDGAYSRKQFLKMEINVLKTIEFDLGIPLSYSFLRRYARCAKVTMPVLTLARYILELSLMDYAAIALSESKLAAAALYMALRMKYVSEWTPTLEFYTGYKLEQLMHVVRLLNDGLHMQPMQNMEAVRNKYSHKIFFEVAKTPLLSNKDLE